MRIGIDAYPLTRDKITGLGTYLDNLIRHLEAKDLDNEYFLYGCRNFTLPFENNRWHMRLIKGPRFIRKISTLWLLWGARKMLLTDKIDIFLGTQNFVPLFLPKSIKKILILHDLSIFVCPQTLPLMLYLVHRSMFKKSLSSAERIIADSNSTRNDIDRFFPSIDDKKINTVILGGPGEIFRPGNREEARSHISKRFNSSAKFILTVTSLERRKNLTGLLKAFYLCKTKFNITHKLLIVGGEQRSGVNEIYGIHKELSLEGDVRFLGHLEIEDLVCLYNGADLFVFPSFYEGFGLPPLEAMACGTPVVASDIPVFREVLGDAALLVDPYKPEEIARAIYRILTDKELAEDLIQKGFERVKLFSWEKTARETLEVFKKCLEI